MQLVAQKREELGKKVKKLRLERKLPAVVFGKDLESIPVVVDLIEFKRVYDQAGETELVDLVLDETTEKILIKEAQYDPITLEFVHVNFHQVNLKEKIQANIPVELIGEEANELIESKEAIALLITNEITVEAFPTDLPHKFVVDVSGLEEIGDGILVSDLDFDKEKVEIVDLTEESLVAKLDYAVQEEEEEEEELTEEELLEKLEVTEESDVEDDEDGDGAKPAEPKKEEKSSE